MQDRYLLQLLGLDLVKQPSKQVGEITPPALLKCNTFSAEGVSARIRAQSGIATPDARDARRNLPRLKSQEDRSA